MIPIYSATGALIKYMAAALFEPHAGRFNLVRNKRGHVKRAYIKGVVSCDHRPASYIGIAFHQHVADNCAPVWALGGVIGS